MVRFIRTNDSPSVETYTPGSTSSGLNGDDGGVGGDGGVAPPPAPATTPTIRPVEQSMRTSSKAGAPVTAEWAGAAPLTSLRRYKPSSAVLVLPFTVMKATSSTDAADPLGQ